MNKKIITLTSDFGNSGFYAASLKGSILSLVPDATIVDISHNINSFDMKETVFIIQNTYKSFPKGTIHIICVNAETFVNYNPIVMMYDDQYFICADNGTLSLMTKSKPYHLYEITHKSDNQCYTFMSKSTFVEVAAAIANENDLTSFIKPISDFKVNLLNFIPTIEGNELRGKIIYIDSYENAITNITKKMFIDHVGDNPFEITIRSRIATVDRISSTYSDIILKDETNKECSLVALFGSHGYLEISLYLAKAASLLGLKVDSTVIVSRL